MAKVVFFDVANTLLEKPAVYVAIQRVLKENGFETDIKEITLKHKLLSEVIEFPDRTSGAFYTGFNKDLLYMLGILPSDHLLGEIFKACTYLPWVPFADTSILKKLDLPLGIISNWNNSLEEKLKEHFQVPFQWILGSEKEQIRKPQRAFYERVIDRSGFDAADIVYIGDSIKLDVEPALNLGLKAILIDRIGAYPNTSVRRITSLEDLPKHL